MFQRFSPPPFSILLLTAALVLICIHFNCKKDTPIPPNPFDAVQNNGTIKTDTLNPASFTGLHRNIFSVKCANPGCRDGSFEPDFRTVQSAYAELVFQPTIKKLKPWAFRVWAGDTARSWLWARVTRQIIISGKDTSQGRMPLYKEMLTTEELGNLSKWILGGAKDISGKIPSIPNFNQEPDTINYVAVNASYKRIDTIKDGGVFYHPFLIDNNISFKIVVVTHDDSTDISKLKNNKLKFSLNMDDFTAAKVYSGTYMTFPPFKFWEFNVTNTAYPPGTVVYMRYYTNDGNHVWDTEFPRNDMPIPYKTYWSFKIKP